MADWANDAEQAMVEMWETRPCLFNVASADYSNRIKKAAALAEISGEIGQSACLLGAAAGTKLGCARGRCYVQHTEQVTWEQARARCRVQGGRLAVIRDVIVQDSLRAILQYSRAYVSIWIGARNTGNVWTWQDGQPFYGAEVDYYDHPMARCGYLYTGFRARVAAAPCSSNKKYLCSSISGNVPARGASPRSWYEANHDCAARQKVLPMMSQSELQLLADRLVPDYGHDEYWVGLCRQGWVWQDTGEDVVYTHFNGQTPYCTQNKCMSLNYRGEWFNENCHSKRGFLCELPDSKMPPPVILPVLPPAPLPRPDPPTPRPVTPWPVITTRPLPTLLMPTPRPTSHKTTSTTLVPHAAHGEDADQHSHAVLIGVIVGLGVVISGLVALLVLLVLRKRRGKQPEEKDNMENIYSEIREPPSSLPPALTPAMDNLYLDNPSPHPSPRPSPRTSPSLKHKVHSKPMPLPKPDKLKAGCEMSTFKKHNPKRLSMAPPSGPPPDQPPPDQPRTGGARCADPPAPYAVSYIACTPREKSDTLDSLAALPEAPKPPLKPSRVPNGRLVLPPPPSLSVLAHSRGDDEDSRYMLPKDEAAGRLLKEQSRLDAGDAGPLKGGKPRMGKPGVRESASLMLEENDLYADCMR